MTNESYLLTLNGPKKSYKSLTKWFPDGSISILCLDVENNSSFRVSIDDDTLKRLKVEARVEDFDKSLEESFKYGSDKYEFINGTENEIKWKAIGERGFKLTLGQFSIQGCDFKEAVKEIFNSSTDQIEELKRKEKEKTQELAKIKALVKDYREKFEKAIEEKKNLEEELFSQFLPILNAKKRRIRQLQDMKKDDGENEENEDVAPHVMSDSDEEDKMASSSSLIDKNTTADSQNFLNLSSF